MTKKELKEKRQITREERDKRLVMWTGVSFFMILIVFLWFINTKKVFNRINENNKIQNIESSEVSDKIDKTFEEIKEKLNILNQQLVETESDEVENIPTSSPQLGDQEQGDENINKESIEALEENTGASSTDNIYEKE